MITTHEAVLEAVFALVDAALPAATVKRNAKPQRLDQPGGLVVVWDGEPGEPEMDLSPPVFNFQRRVMLGFGAYASASKTASQVTAEMKQLVADAVAADRFLGGLAEWVETAAADPQALEQMGVDIADLELGGIDVTYATASAL